MTALLRPPQRRVTRGGFPSGAASAASVREIANRAFTRAAAGSGPALIRTCASEICSLARPDWELGHSAPGGARGE